MAALASPRFSKAVGLDSLAKYLPLIWRRSVSERLFSNFAL